MNKLDLLKLIYPDEITFEYDTALPAQINRQIANILSTKMRMETHEIHAELFMCVYAYGKGNICGQGYIPLTLEARNMLQYYLEITGINLFYIPAVDVKAVQREQIYSKINAIESKDSKTDFEVTYLQDLKQELENLR